MYTPHTQENADGRRRERIEFADGRPRDLGLTGLRLRMLEHTACPCGEPATCLIGNAYVCNRCVGWETTKRRARRMGVR